MHAKESDKGRRNVARSLRYKPVPRQETEGDAPPSSDLGNTKRRVKMTVSLAHFGILTSAPA